MTEPETDELGVEPALEAPAPERRPRRGAPLVLLVVAIVGGLAFVFGGVGTLVGLIMAFTAVGGEAVDPSQKARLLAEGISMAMNWMAASLAVLVACGGVAVGYAVYVVLRDRQRAEGPPDRRAAT